MKKKLHIEKISGGAKIFAGRSYGALKNLIPLGDGLAKRNGHKAVTVLKDENGTPLRINGIFSYSYLKDGVPTDCKIVHAGAHIFKLDKDFNYICELEAPDGMILRDERSRAFLKDGSLYVIGAGDILICDGETLKSAYFTSGTYVPTTARMITDRKMGMRCEAHQSPNILNPRRKNKLMGGSTHKKLDEENIFLLDGEIAYKKPLTIDIKIRTKVSSDSDNDYTTSYIGINEVGEEVSTVVNLHYARENVDDTVIFFLTEPIRNERGEKIRIKIGDKIHDYDTVPFGVRLKNHRELCLGFDVDAPYPNEENIVIEYESSDTYRDLLDGVELATVGINGEGKELLLFTRGENELYFSDPENGFSYLPRDNKIVLGGADKITSVIQLWDNLIGVFKENEFYRVRFSENGYEAVSSADSQGAFSLFSTSICASDCLVLNTRGVFGVDNYKSSVREVCLLSPRSSDIDDALSKYTKEEKREAVSCVDNGRYYLFIGDDCYVGVSKSGNGEYDWFPWYGFGANVAYVFDGEIYFGTKNGEIRKMHKEYEDVSEVEYSSDTLSLIVDNEGEKTRLITDETEASFGVRAKLGEHLIYIGRVQKINGGISFKDGAPTYKDGSVKLFYGDTLLLKNGEDEEEKAVGGVLQSNVYFEGECADASAENEAPYQTGEFYEVYQRKQSGTYEAEWENGAIYLKIGGERVKIEGFSSVVLEKRVKIQGEYKTAPLPIGTHRKNATVTKLYLNAYSGTEGEIETQISTRASKYTKKITTAPPLNFGALDFNRLDVTYGLDVHIPIPFFVRGFDYLDVKITSSDENPVYIGFFMLEYYAA